MRIQFLLISLVTVLCSHAGTHELRKETMGLTDRSFALLRLRYPMPGSKARV
ncbi:MAG: hypothetical protein JNM91_04270, partial [Flavobacteriales bacterium]|nr:hypothetical protein [Flavobacteriales bacterium]